MRRRRELAVLVVCVVAVALVMAFFRTRSEFSIEGVYLGDRAASVIRAWAPYASEFMDGQGHRWISQGHIDYNARARLSAFGWVVEVRGYNLERQGRKVLHDGETEEVVLRMLGAPHQRLVSNEQEAGLDVVDYIWPDVTVRMVAIKPAIVAEFLLGHTP